jgi:hypothetical protein
VEKEKGQQLGGEDVNKSVTPDPTDQDGGWSAGELSPDAYKSYWMSLMTGPRKLNIRPLKMKRDVTGNKRERPSPTAYLESEKPLDLFSWQREEGKETLGWSAENV